MITSLLTKSFLFVTSTSYRKHADKRARGPVHHGGGDANQVVTWIRREREVGRQLRRQLVRQLQLGPDLQDESDLEPQRQGQISR